MNRWNLVLFLGLSIGAGTSAHGGEVAYWAANGTALDSLGNGHNGTLENGAGFGPGIVGEAFAFNGVNQYVSVPASRLGVRLRIVFDRFVGQFQLHQHSVIGELPNTFVGADNGAGFQDKWVFFYSSSGSLEFHINGPDAGGTVFLELSLDIFPELGT